MVKLNVNLTTPQTQDGDEIPLIPSRGGGGTSFELIEPGFYSVIVKKLQTLDDDESVYMTRNGEDSFLKIRPHLQILNESRTIISRQDFTVGYYDDKRGLYTKEADRSPVWGGISGARSLLTALGMFKDMGDGRFNLDLDTDIVVNRVVRVRVGVAGYVKGEYSLTDTIRYPRNFNEVMGGLKDSIEGSKEWTISSLDMLIPAFNEQHGLTSDSGIKTKNVAIAFYGVADWEAQEQGWVIDGDSVFLSAQDWDNYQVAKEDLDNESADW